MSTTELLLRYIHIVNRVSKSPATFKEIDDYLTRQSAFQDYKFNISQRQFLRDLKKIGSILEIEIYYDPRQGVYLINEAEFSELSRRRLEAFDTFNALKIGDSTSRLIHFEKRRPQGTENLFGVLHAIKNNLQINFTYQKFWEEQVTERSVHPLALKEFKNRWYLLSKDMKDGAVKTFALDRLTTLDITPIKFKPSPDFDIEEQFRYCFGIISPTDEEPQEIILSFTPFQGKYIKSLPLHESQKILIDDKNELRIKLKLFVTHDLIMELLSFGDNMKVLQPDSLISHIRTAHKTAYQQY
ncbi:WYL domain-containing protein [bacterium]|nr:WYL domain-containing protein [bacterium]